MKRRAATRTALLALSLIFATQACNRPGSSGQQAANPPATANTPAAPQSGKPIAPADALKIGFLSAVEVRGGSDAYTDIVVESVLLASKDSGGKTVTTGTMTEDAEGNVTYSDAPQDRLRVVSAEGTSAEFFISAIRGDFSGEAEDFLRKDYELRFRVVDEKSSDLQIAASQQGGQFQRTIQGTFVNNDSRYTMNADEQGTSAADAGGGDQSTISGKMTGTLTAANFSLNVNEEFSDQTRSAENSDLIETFNRTINTGWSVGADKFQFQNVAVKQRFADGLPTELDTFWQAQGALLRNGQPYGQLRVTVEDSEARILLETPEGKSILQSWKLR